MLSMEDARARVAKGAAHLDQVKPGWEDRIDIGTLTLHDTCGCIVGQLCGSWSPSASYFRSQATYDLRVPDVVAYGFELERGEGAWHVNVPAPTRLVLSYVPLQDAWVEAIADRRLKTSAHIRETPMVDATTDDKRVACVVGTSTVGRSA